MEVKGLIEKLKTLPADALILVQGYEDGFDDIIAVKEIRVVERPAPRTWEGQYKDAEKDSKSAIAAIVVLGDRR